MKRTAQEIADYVGGELRGDPAMVLDSIASLKNAGPSDLSYAEERGQNDVNRSHAGCVLLRSGEFPSRTVIGVLNPKLAFARAAAWLLAEASDDAGIHPSATVDSVLQRSEEHTSELQSRSDLVCRLLLEKKNASL